MRRRQRQRAMGGLAGSGSVLRRFNAVIDAVANQVGQRIADAFDDTLVQLGAFADRLQLDLLVEARGQVVTISGEAGA